MSAFKNKLVGSPRLTGTGSVSSGSTSSTAAPALPSPTASEFADLSPELIPIVTLISSQVHRRYHEGIFMLYYDLNGDGKPADREWKEVYGILTGNQLAYWDAATLAQFRHNPDGLLETSAKPNYINFTDSVYNAMKVLPAAKQNLDNVIIVSTTLKNRYLLQFKSYSDLTLWYSALRLSNYEYSQLQQAYTGALLSSRGRMLSDIRTILAEKRFEHEDWVSIRYGSGMAWKRCFAVIEPSTTKRKHFLSGRVLFYENDQKKKKQLLAVINSATAVCAIYPQSHKLIDHSTMLKLEARINFKSPSLSTKVSKKTAEDFKTTSIFLMPQQHSSVPGFDTLIRFLMPLLDSFGLYGRPKRLKADRVDPDSLLFGLPTLPFVHYLELDDVSKLTSYSEFLSWDAASWNDQIKAVIKGKLARGYEGCGSQRGVAGAISTLSSPSTPTIPQHKDIRRSPQKKPAQLMKQPTNSSNLSARDVKVGAPQEMRSGVPQEMRSGVPQGVPQQTRVGSQPSKNVQNLTINPGPSKAAPMAEASLKPTNKEDPSTSPALGSDYDPHKSLQLADIYAKYSSIKAPSDRFYSERQDLLNGSHESIDVENLPSDIRKLSVYQDMYPRNDYADDVSSTESATDSGGAGGSGSQLQLPSISNRNSSYSSVKSPMTQYQEFNEQFGRNVQTSGLSKQQGRQEFSGFSDDDELPPAPPAHRSGRDHEKVNSVSYGTGMTIEGDNRKLSVHSEQGKLSSGSSLYSQTTSPQQQRTSPGQVYPSIDSVKQAQVAHSPRITSPNINQNRPQWGMQHTPQHQAAPRQQVVPPRSPKRSPEHQHQQTIPPRSPKRIPPEPPMPQQMPSDQYSSSPQRRAAPANQQYAATQPLSPVVNQYPASSQFAPRPQQRQQYPPQNQQQYLPQPPPKPPKQQHPPQQYQQLNQQQYQQPPQQVPQQQYPPQTQSYQQHYQQPPTQQQYPPQGYQAAPQRTFQPPQQYPTKKPGQRTQQTPMAAHHMAGQIPGMAPSRPPQQQQNQQQGYPQQGYPQSEQVRRY